MKRFCRWFCPFAISKFRVIIDFVLLSRIGPHRLDQVGMSNKVELDIRRRAKLGFIDATLAAERARFQLNPDVGMELLNQSTSSVRQLLQFYRQKIPSEEAYNALPKYCEEVLRSNPGSTVKLEIDSATSQFKGLFICFAGSAMGFVYCRPVIGIDGTHLKHKYQGNGTTLNIANCRDSSCCNWDRCKWCAIPSCSCSGQC